MMNKDLEQYRIETPSFWEALPMMGYSGYDAIELATSRKWSAIPSWGQNGWDLGNWPLVIVFFRDRIDAFDVIEYVEGDVVAYACPTKELRDAITDEIAFYHWRFTDCDWVKDYTSVEQLPPELRGPFSQERLEQAEAQAEVK